MSLLKQDFQRWCQIKGINDSFMSFARLFLIYPEFRTIVYFRWKQKGWIGKVAGRVLNIFLRAQTNCYIYTPSIGGGLYIQHGFATIITAQSSKQLSEEEIYYIEHCKTSTHWSGHR